MMKNVLLFLAIWVSCGALGLLLGYIFHKCLCAKTIPVLLKTRVTTLWITGKLILGPITILQVITHRLRHRHLWNL